MGREPGEAARCCHCFSRDQRELPPERVCSSHPPTASADRGLRNPAQPFPLSPHSPAPHSLRLLKASQLPRVWPPVLLLLHRNQFLSLPFSHALLSLSQILLLVFLPISPKAGERGRPAEGKEPQSCIGRQMSCLVLVADVDDFGQTAQILVWAPVLSSVDGVGSPHGGNPMPHVVSELVP